MRAPDDIADVLGAHLGPRERSRGGPALLRKVLIGFGMRRTTREPDEEAAALLRLIGGDAVDLERLERDVRQAVDDARARGVADEAFPALAQAYARGVGRIVDAEAEVVREVLAGTPAERRADTLDELLASALPVSSDTFDVLHAALLRDALVEALVPETLNEAEDAPAAIALVDLVASTDYLASASRAETAALVDGLFEAGQLATAHGAVRPVKYVGDGVFVGGRNVFEVASAALDVLDHLRDRLPIPARAGLAYGPVLRRAGDFFGMPMNMAQILTKGAEPSSLLASEAAAELLPEDMLGRRRTLRGKHGHRTKARVVVRAAAG